RIFLDLWPLLLELALGGPHHRLGQRSDVESHGLLLLAEVALTQLEREDCAQVLLDDPPAQLHLSDTQAPVTRLANLARGIGLPVALPLLFAQHPEARLQQLELLHRQGVL